MTVSPLLKWIDLKFAGQILLILSLSLRNYLQQEDHSCSFRECWTHAFRSIITSRLGQFSHTAMKQQLNSRGTDARKGLLHKADYSVLVEDSSPLICIGIGKFKICTLMQVQPDLTRYKPYGHVQPGSCFCSGFTLQCFSCPWMPRGQHQVFPASELSADRLFFIRFSSNLLRSMGKNILPAQGWQARIFLLSEGWMKAKIHGAHLKKQHSCSLQERKSKAF